MTREMCVLAVTVSLLAACAASGTAERGRILDRDGRVLATNVTAAGDGPVRTYPHGRLTSHAVGYVGRAEPAGQASHEWIGRSASERAFEAELAAGHDVTLSLSVPLQEAAREAMKPHRAGAVVALDPRTGEVLALYTKPEFDPDLMAGRLDQQTWASIQAGRGLDARLQHRAVQPYTPGSTFKLATALAGLEHGALPQSHVCAGHVDVGKRRFHCHKRDGHGELDLVRALAVSCGTYFYAVGASLPMADIAATAQDLGFGQPTGIALGEHSGQVPTGRKWYDAHTQHGWSSGLRLAQAGGHGSVEVTPLQLARAVAAIANGGKLWEVHMARRIGDDAVAPRLTRKLRASEASLAQVRRGMEAATAKGGTAQALAAHPSRVAGKTGTAMAPILHGRAAKDQGESNHGWFVGYAPSDAPRIVVVAFVERGGVASRVAVPVADAVLTRWLELDLE